MNAYFVGIGGMGMSGIAKILHLAGGRIAGSDRALDGDYCKRLRALGIPIYPQDGTGLDRYLQEFGVKPDEAVVVKSTAVEDQVPDIVAARRLGLREIMRSDLLASLFNAKLGIAIAGTAGKTTTSGLAAWLLKFAGLEPTCAIGGVISGLDTNAFRGTGPHFVIEADESDGSIVKYRPYVALLTNISRDHKPLEELMALFATYLGHTDPAGAKVLCGDDPHIAELRKGLSGKVITYGCDPGNDVHPEKLVVAADHSTFAVGGVPFEIGLPGRHNVLNALGVIAIGRFLGLPLEEMAAALRAFPGMKRRFEKVGTAQGVTIIDDFAHNPAEIEAAIDTARRTSKRRFIVYQPHGFGPTRFTRQDLVKVFRSLRPDEFLYLDDIYYGGGTVEKDISSKDIVEEVRAGFPNVYYHGDRQRIVTDIVNQAQAGDMVLVMGARDINRICQEILDRL
ncbi:MAG: UDP-N-acetylmuramate--alanine ligase [Candidatus Ozemobacter sibiricus]|jgi:UDP-N-acetylmuramate--alanine ligase|uniref:UDP-N-acetylmuramate--L-alanine ligase n=1 Tax=Candidatus Ozemobacter sibiricus TaxID=2268124 RepID=A0A367ZIK8_9BACT|nr:MAG: UDP-N-acetylmuramate--alanine ligase [Candidatus Ozemobacter sibiricus]